MIERRGNQAGQQVVKEANERAEREERLMREAQELKAQQDAAKVAHETATRERQLAEVAASRSAQLAYRQQLKAQKQAEELQFVEEVCVPHKLRRCSSVNLVSAIAAPWRLCVSPDGCDTAVKLRGGSR